jgi:membrane protein DedA with SNARE-associated domain
MPSEMKLKVWIWTAVLAFLGYSIATKGAIENMRHELIGLIGGGALGLVIGWGLQLYDERRNRRGPSKPGK